MSRRLQKLENRHYETTTIRFLQFDSYQFCTHFYARAAIITTDLSVRQLTLQMFSVDR